MAMAQWRIDLAKAVETIKLFDPQATDEAIVIRLYDKFSHHTKDGLTKNVIIGVRRDYKAYQESSITSPPLVKQWSGSGYEYLSITLPRYDIDPVFHGDYMLIGDIHLPSTNWALSAVMLEIAKKHLDKPKFLIVGDLLNLDSMSSYDTIVPIESLQTEINMAKGYLEQLMKVGDVDVLPGNHDYRWSKKLEGKLSIMGLWELIQHGMKTGNIRFHADTGAWVHSGGRKWRVTHQRNYSRLKLKIGNTLATNRQTDTVTFHQHHFAGGISDNGLYATIDNGGLHESAAIHYANMYDGTMPRMTSGFGMLRNGVYHQFSPYKQLTDYSMWGVDASALFAHEHKKQQIYLGNYTRDSNGIVQFSEAA